MRLPLKMATLKKLNRGNRNCPIYINREKKYHGDLGKFGCNKSIVAKALAMHCSVFVKRGSSLLNTY
jgi:hypothetical protein